MKPIKLGVIGARRGLSFAKSAQNAKSQGLELSCICDFSDEKIENATKDFNVDFYTDFDEMLKSDIDAVVLANFFHEHAPFAIKAMNAG
ncbi:MAG: Gfo/Idh/MocA family oxidoreductase, partial [Clostridiales bacterium]|nr:Gfo/Idh/MocA family oxidoreductase [Clostridiales bacterium]